MSVKKRISFPRSWMILVPVVFSFLHCLYPPARDSSRTEEGTSSAARVFAHRKHEETLKKEQFHCTDCHLYNLAYLERDKKINEAVTRVLTRAGKESCHFCHRDNPERTKTRLKCIDCHADIRPIRPADHRAGWQKSHGSQVDLGAVACNQCHSPRFCIECHTRRDEADRKFHTGSAIMTHPIEARANPARCQACHHPSYCLRCHKTGRF